MLDARTVQQTLTALGYYRDAIDGNLRHERFRDALKKLQQDKGLEVDGLYGRESDRALTKVLACGVEPARLRKWRLTDYYVADQRDYPGSATATFPDGGFKELARGTPEFFCDAALEGTGRLADGRLINVAALKPVPAGSRAWDAVLACARRKFPSHVGYGGVVPADDGSVARVMTWSLVTRVGVGYGVGKRQIPYTPFRTVASDIGAYKTSDPRFRGAGGLVPPGTRALIVDLIGTKLPDGSIHDGWVTANDTGSAIYGAHFDLFTGSRAMKKAVKHAHVAHVWFEGIEARVTPDYRLGLTKL